MNERQQVILDAIREFDFDDYGCDEMTEIVRDPDLDLAQALARHISRRLRVVEAKGAKGPGLLKTPGE